MIKKSLIITHTDLDGLASAILFMKYNPEKIFDVIFTEPEHLQNRPKSLNFDILSEYYEEIIILDLPTPKIEEKEILKKIKVIDHHIKNHPEQIIDFENEGKYIMEAPSTARLIQMLFNKNDYEDIIEIVDKIDSANIDKEFLKLTRHGWNKQDLLNFVNVISRNRTSYKLYHILILLNYYFDHKKVPHTILEESREINKEKYEFYYNVPKEIKNIGKYRVGIFYLDNYSEEDEKKFDKWLPSIVDNTDAAIIVKRDSITIGWNIFRKDACPFHIGELCKEFGGGGHRTIGGCPKSQEVIDRFLKLLEK